MKPTQVQPANQNDTILPPHNAMAMEEKPRVFIRDQAYAWIPGSIQAIRDGKAIVKIELPNNWHSSTVLCQDSGLEEVENALVAVATGNSGNTPSVMRSVTLASYPNGQLPLQNKCAQKSDMTSLPHLHEAAMLYNLKERLSKRQPYTRVRDVIIAMNPFQKIEELYSLQTQQSYADNLVWNTQDERKENDGLFVDNGRVEPHIYEVSCLAYCGVMYDNQDQTIIVTGESGSGKTETVNSLLEHLVTLECLGPGENATIPGFDYDVINKLIESSVVLEAFGNAKTRRNSNSSRFGKLMQLQFANDTDYGRSSIPSCSLVGSSCTTYLLEKTRVTFHSVGERSFHIFYQLLAAPSELKRAVWPSFESSRPTEFSYLAQFGERSLESLDDANQWNRTETALRVFGIVGEDLKTLLRAIAIVLQMGNLKFENEQTASGEWAAAVTTKEELLKLSDMIGIHTEELVKVLTTRVIKTKSEEIQAPLQAALAKESANALAMEIYDKIFSFIVRRMNDQMRLCRDKVSGTLSEISLVDIYGFERLAVNRFEQLCINYANEQIQQKYVADNFRILKDQYDEEGIDIFDFCLVDNSDVLELLDGPSGVFIKLQEECLRPVGNDEAFVRRMKQVNETHSRLISEQLHSATEFGVRHFAGPVTYDAAKFVDRNINRICTDLLACAAQTSNSLIREELQQGNTFSGEPGEQSMYGMTVIEKFSTELRDLLFAMDGTKTRYIRCIVPNELTSPGITDHLLVLRQLEYAGLMTSVALTRENLPDSLSFQAIINRFSCLLGNVEIQKMESMENSQQIIYLLTTIFMPSLRTFDDKPLSMPFACGKTKVYIRAGALDHLENLRNKYFFVQALALQVHVRRWQARCKFLRQRRAIVKMQSFVRKLISMKRQRRVEAAVCTLGVWMRKTRRRKCLLSTLNFKVDENSAARKIQLKLRLLLKSKNQKETERRVEAAAKIQLRWRLVRQQHIESRQQGAAKKIQCKCRSMLSRFQGIEEYLAASKIQSKWRSILAVYVLKINLAARIVQSKWRSIIANALVKMHRAAKRIQSKWRSILVAAMSKRHLQSAITVRARFRPQRIPAKLLSIQNEPSLEVSNTPSDDLMNETNELPGISELELLRDENAALKWQCSLLEQTRKGYSQDEAELSFLKSENAALKTQCAELQKRSHEMTSEIRCLRDCEAKASIEAKAGVERIQEMTRKLAKLNQQILQNESTHRQELEQLQELLSEEETLHGAEIQKTTAQHKREIALLKSTNDAALKEQLEHQEEKSRAEKQVLCNIIEEAEGIHEEKLKILKEEIEQGQVLRQQLQSQLDAMRDKYENDMKTAAEQYALSLSDMKAEKVAAENKLVTEENAAKAKLQETRDELERIKAEHAREKHELHDDLAVAQEAQQKLRSEIDQLTKEKETATAALKNKDCESARLYEKAREDQLKQDVDIAESKYREEIQELSEKLFWTQEAERQLKSEISEMESSHIEELEKTKNEILVDFHAANTTISELKEKLEMQKQKYDGEEEQLCRVLEENHNEQVRKLEEVQRQLKAELNRLQATHAEEIETLMTEALNCRNNDQEIQSLKDKMQEQEEGYREEQAELRALVKKHPENVHELKKELCATQESHITSLLHIISELEHAQAERSEVMDIMFRELEAVGRDNDEKIVVFQRELAAKFNALNQSPGLPAISEEGDGISCNEPLTEQFNDTLHKLQLAVKPANLMYIFEKLKKKQDLSIETKVLTEIHRLSIELGELYAKKDQEHRQIQQEVITFVQGFASPSEYRQSILSKANLSAFPKPLLHELQHQVETTEKHNRNLKKNFSIERNLVVDPITSPVKVTKSVQEPFQWKTKDAKSSGRLAKKSKSTRYAERRRYLQK